MITIFFTLNDEGYLTGWQSNRSSENDIELEISRDHEFFKSDALAYKYVNNELIKDEEVAQKRSLEYEQEQNELSDEELNALAIMELGKLIMNGGE